MLLFICQSSYLQTALDLHLKAAAGSLPSDSMVATTSFLSAPCSTTVQNAAATAVTTPRSLAIHPNTAVDTHQATAHGPTAVVDTPQLLHDQPRDDYNATAMSIDTPSYARSMGMGQIGSSSGFARGPFHVSQDLAQSMSIDSCQVDQVFGHGAAATSTGQ